MTMKKHILLAGSAFVVATASIFVACSGDDNNGSPTPAADAGADGTTAVDGAADTGTLPDSATLPDTGTDAGTPAPPTLGTQIDRIGRPAINTALNHGFDGDASAAGAAKDSYNADKVPSGWAASYAPQFAANLAILDSLDTVADGGGCGNQPFAQDDAGANRYATLSGVLAGDMLWLNTAGTTCTTYLAVELNATHFLTNTDCGGRRISDDVIQTTYSVTSGVGLSGFGSGVSAIPAKTNGTTFPYLATPL
jgi:Domain of unknown function (DUF4331)